MLISPTASAPYLLQTKGPRDPDRPYDANGLTAKDQLALLSQREQSLVELGQQALGPEDRANGRLWFPPKVGAQGP